MVVKAELRRQILDQRQSLSWEAWEQKSYHLCLTLQSSRLFKDANTILAYSSFRQEPNLSSLFSNTNKAWGLPRCVDKSLFWHRYFPGEDLQKGVYGILEPDPNSPILEAKDVDLILVPAVACDRQGYRLGYGGGFYDRLLSQEPWREKPTIGIVFDFALLPKIPIDAWDQPLTGICTEREIYDGQVA